MSGNQRGRGSEFGCDPTESDNQKLLKQYDQGAYASSHEYRIQSEKVQILNAYRFPSAVNNHETTIDSLMKVLHRLISRMQGVDLKRVNINQSREYGPEVSWQ